MCLEQDLCFDGWEERKGTLAESAKETSGLPPRPFQGEISLADDELGRWPNFAVPCLYTGLYIGKGKA